MRAVAIVCVRNESIHVRACLGDLIGDGIDVVLIDNDSTDDSVNRARSFLGQGLIDIHRIPWTGEFSLYQQLSFKLELIKSLDYDWVLHVDADERLYPHTGKKTLIEALAEVDAAGFNCIDFEEFVFVPKDNQDFEFEEYRSSMLTYYCFQPRGRNLMRAWKRSAGLSNVDGAGHNLTGPQIRVFPQLFNLRHYIMLSRAHGRRKYLNRIYSRSEVDRGWHSNRVIITEENLIVKDHPALRDLGEPSSRKLQTDRPVTAHFWEW